ncbi:MAG: hypothetical protein NVS1B6_06040 [Steroidobacteraceae bacterium]
MSSGPLPVEVVQGLAQQARWRDDVQIREQQLLDLRHHHSAVALAQPSAAL